MKPLIEKLLQIVGPSGYEQAVRDAIRGEIEGLVDEIRVDAMGNLIAVKHAAAGAKNPQKIMLSAHMDEIGLIVTHVDDKGFVRFVNIGGVRALNCVGGRVKFLNGAQGLIYMDRLDDPSKAPTVDNLYVDVGATSRENCPVKVGELGIFDRPFLDLGDRLVSKAMDDRISCAVMVQAIKDLPASGVAHEVYFVFSTQEEVGLRGATTAAYGVDPDLGLSIDVTGTGDAPKSGHMECALGSGSAIKVRDGGMLSDPRVVRWMVNTAEKAGLPYQLEVLEGGTTDARAIQLARAGVPVGCLSIPTRYIHSPSEMVDYNDVLNSVKLLVALITQPVVLD